MTMNVRSSIHAAEGARSFGSLKSPSKQVETGTAWYNPFMFAAPWKWDFARQLSMQHRQEDPKNTTLSLGSYIVSACKPDNALFIHELPGVIQTIKENYQIHGQIYQKYDTLEDHFN